MAKKKKTVSNSSSSQTKDDVPVIVYKKPQKKIRHPVADNRNRDDQQQQLPPNVKKLKLDVYRLLARSATNLTSTPSSSTPADSKKAARHALAIALGAEPPKPKAINFKQYQADLKERRRQEKEKEILRNISDVNLGKKKQKKDQRGSNRKREGGGGGGGGRSSLGGGGVGSFKGGVLRLSKDDVTRIKNTKILKF